MEIAALTAYLAPLLGFLLKAADKAAGGAADRLGDAVGEHAERLWARLWPRVKDKPAADEAVQDVAAAPESQGARDALNWQLEKLFAADPELLADVERLWAQRPGATTVSASDHSFAVGGNIDRSAIVIGDGNKVERPA